MGLRLLSFEEQTFAALHDDKGNNDALYNAKDARMLVIEETDGSVALQGAVIKKFTGRCEAEAMKKYGANIKFKPKWTINFVVNEANPLPEGDPAANRRPDSSVEYASV